MPDPAPPDPLTAPAARPDPGSFRDPGNRVFMVDGQIYRALDRRNLDAWEALGATRFFGEQMVRGNIVDTEAVEGVAAPAEAPPGGWAGVLRHRRIPIVSYPYEWTFSMLRDAALLQLELLDAALAEDMILKDSTPYNVQFVGARPVFIDIGSFEPLESGDIWVGYRQFLRQYLYPLMLRCYVGVPHQPWLRGDMEGPTAEQMVAMLPTRHRLHKATLLHVTLPARGERRYRDSPRDFRSEFRAAGFKKELIQSNVRGLRATVERLDWDHGRSTWNSYADECSHVARDRGPKTAFLERVVAEHRPATVWDLGANDGHFSRVAATVADSVLAVDADEEVLDRFYRQLRADGEREHPAHAAGPVLSVPRPRLAGIGTVPSRGTLVARSGAVLRRHPPPGGRPQRPVATGGRLAGGPRLPGHPRVRAPRRPDGRAALGEQAPPRDPRRLRRGFAAPLPGRPVRDRGGGAASRV